MCGWKHGRYGLIFAMIFLSILQASAEVVFSADEEESRQKQRDARAATETPQIVMPKRQDNLDLNIYISATEGFDSNVFLDSSRKGDLFDEAVVGLGIKNSVNDSFAFKIDYSGRSITYHEYSDFSMFDNDISLTVEYYIGKAARLRAGYDADFINYMKNENGDFLRKGPFADFRYFIAPRTYVGAGYSYQLYDYDKRKIRNGENQMLDMTREDHRHNIMGEFATKLGKLSFKLKNIYYFNESNDGYMDFYDYTADRVSGYIAYPVHKKLQLIFNGGYLRKDFKSRKITGGSSKEYDDLMILGGGAYYIFSPSLFLNANYTYRQNYSNDPVQEYSGTTGTVGLHYFF